MWRRFTDIFVEYVNPSHVSCDELAVSVAVAGISYQLSGDLCGWYLLSALWWSVFICLGMYTMSYQQSDCHEVKKGKEELGELAWANEYLTK